MKVRTQVAVAAGIVAVMAWAANPQDPPTEAELTEAWIECVSQGVTDAEMERCDALFGARDVREGR